MYKKSFGVIVFVIGLTWQSCEYEVIPGAVDCSENPVTIDLVSSTEANCALNDGSVEVVAAGGGGNYRFVLDDGEPQTSAVFGEVAAGVYQITALDQNNCSATMEVTVRNQNGMNINFVATEAGGCSGSNGTLTVNAFDGTGPYQYKLGDGSYSPNHTFTGLSRGEYDLTVTDATGCEVTQPVMIRSGISFAESIAPIIQRSCAINDCHNGSQFPDFRVFKNIHDNAGQIKALTGDRTMPQEGSLTQAEINMIACWVDDGAPAN